MVRIWCMYTFRCSLLCQQRPWSWTIQNGATVKTESSPSFRFFLFLHSCSCIPQLGSFLHSPHTKYIPHHSSAICLHFTGSYFLLTCGQTLSLMGESTFLLWLNFKSNTTTSCPHFFSFFTVVFLLSLSLFILPFFFFAPSPSSFKSLGSLWYHSMRQQSFGDILSCCMAV